MRDEKEMHLLTEKHSSRFKGAHLKIIIALAGWRSCLVHQKGDSSVPVRTHA